MSRLIDGDKIDFNEVFKGQSFFAVDMRNVAQSLIDAQPTAMNQTRLWSSWRRTGKMSEAKSKQAVWQGFSWLPQLL